MFFVSSPMFHIVINVALDMLNYVIIFYGCCLVVGSITMGFSYCHGGHCDNVCGMKLDKV
jgi:hypothetical protein